MTKRMGPPASRGTGFTFLELLLVIVIIGVMASLIMPSLSSDDDGRVLQQSVAQALSIMALQEEEAILTGSQSGLLIFRRTEEGGEGDEAFHYQWLSWSTVDELWAAAQVPRRFNGVFNGASEALLLVEDRELEIAEYDAQLLPQIVIYASGETTDFELSLMAQEADDKRAEWVLIGGYQGIRLRQEEDDDEKPRR
jgi:general secretion pathway protein H